MRNSHFLTKLRNFSYFMSKYIFFLVKNGMYKIILKRKSGETRSSHFSGPKLQFS